MRGETRKKSDVGKEKGQLLLVYWNDYINEKEGR